MPLRLPKLFNLRSDPFETADHEGMDYERWRVEHVFLLVPAQQYVGQVPRHLQGVPAAARSPAASALDQVHGGAPERCAGWTVAGVERLSGDAALVTGET